MSDLIATLARFSKEDQEYKLSIKFKDGKVYCLFSEKDGGPTLLIKGPSDKVSADISERIIRFLKIIDDEDAGEEVEDNIEEIAEVIEDEKEKEAETAAARATKAANKSKSGKKEEPAKKTEPVKTALETATEKLDKATKATVTKLIERIKKGTTDKDVFTFLINSLTSTLKTALGDDELVTKIVAEVTAGINMDKKEEPAKTEETLFNQPAPTTPAPTPVAAPVVTPPQPAQPVQQAPVAQPAPVTQPAPAGGFDMDEGELF